MTTTRAYQAEPLPSSTYVPGDGRRNPNRGMRHGAVSPVAGDDWAASPAYLRGVDLFNAGFYWEAHESWEAVWLAHGRRGAVATVLKGLIKLAAAGLKVRQGRPSGVRSLVGRAAGHFEEARQEVGPTLLGLDLADWAAFARHVAERPPDTPEGVPEGTAVVVFTPRLRPGGGSPTCDATRRPAAGT